jgi:hypothetical protein
VLKRKIISLLCVSMINNSICAADVSTGKLPVVSDLNVKLGAYASFESGFSNQNKLLKSEKKISANKEGFAFYNDAAFYASISNEINDIEYGGKIVLVPTVKAKVIPAYNGSHVFIKGFYGRVELGSPIPVAANMMISDGGIPIKYIKTSTAHLKQSKNLNSSFLTSDGCFIGDDLTADLDSAPYSSEPPRTINYYTPNFEISDASKVQIGVSYTPDTANTGIGSPSEKSDGINKRTIGKDGVDRFEIDRSVKDAITTGIVFEQKLKEDIGLKLALTGEYGNSTGKAKKFISKEDTEPKEYKLGDLRSFNIGAELEVNDFTYNACYGSWGKSFTTTELHKAGRDSYYYSVGAAYKYNATTTKLTYFASERFKNKANAIKLNITYLLAKGFKPYAEVSSYILKGKPEFYNELKSRTTKGTVFLLGVKLTL